VKIAVHVVSPDVAATRHVRAAATAPAATPLLLLKLMVLLQLDGQGRGAPQFADF